VLKWTNRAFGYGLLLGILVASEALSAAYWTFFPYLSILTPFAQADTDVVHALSPLSPALLLMLLYSWIGILLYKHNNRFSRRLRTFFHPIVSSVQSLRFVAPSGSGNALRLLDHPKSLALIGILSALFLSIIPYRPDLNPNGIPVGIDLHYYVEWIAPMLGKSPSGALSYAMGVASGGSRPLLLLLVYLAVSTGTVSLIQAVEALPAILGPLLVLSIFLFVRESFGDEKIAGIAGLSTAFSFYTTVGIWAGYYANMLALSLGFVFLTLLLRYRRRPTTNGFIFLLLSSVGLLLAHLWTWIIFLAAAVLFAALSRHDPRRALVVKAAALTLALDIGVDFVKSLLFGAPLSAQEASASIAPGFGLSQILNFWPNILNGLFLAYGGLLASALILTLSLFAALSLRIDNVVRRLLLAWIAISSISVIAFSYLLQTRLIYELPFPILIAIGLLATLRRMNRDLNPNLLFLLIMLALVNYSLKSVTSIVATPF